MSDCPMSFGTLDAGLRMAYLGDDGFTTQPFVPLSAWTLDSGDPILTTGTNVLRASYATNGRCIAFTGTLTPSTDKIRLDFPLPRTFRENVERTGRQSEIVATFRIRNTTGTGTTAAIDDANLTFGLAWHAPTYNRKTGAETDGATSISTKTLTAQAIGARVAASAVESFRTLYVPLLGELTAAQRLTLVRGTTFSLIVGVSKALNANNVVQIAHTELFIPGHLTTVDQHVQRRTMA